MTDFRTPAPRGLCDLPRTMIEDLVSAIERGRTVCPVTAVELADLGLGALAPAAALALAGLDRPATLTALRLVLAERAYRPPPRLDLVWSGPEAAGSASHDTERVVRDLFESAQRNVIVGGYAFDTPNILAPLHAAMRDRGVDATLFLEIDGHADTVAGADAYATRVIDRFFHDVWTFGAPRPRVYYDPRTAAPGPPWASLHAKCIVVDDARALVTSANFTDRGQTRNIEVGVRVDDPVFASELSAQWRLLVSAGIVKRYGG